VYSVLLPYKADAVLVVDVNGVLSFAVIFKGVKLVAWRHSQIFEKAGCVEGVQFPLRYLFNRPKSLRTPTFEKFFCGSVPKANDQNLSYRIPEFGTPF
jgi:hypothetical protein